MMKYILLLCICIAFVNCAFEINSVVIEGNNVEIKKLDGAIDKNGRIKWTSHVKRQKLGNFLEQINAKKDKQFEEDIPRRIFSRDEKSRWKHHKGPGHHKHHWNGHHKHHWNHKGWMKHHKGWMKHHKGWMKNHKEWMKNHKGWMKHHGHNGQHVNQFHGKPIDVRPLPPKPVSLQNPKPVSLHNPKPVDVRPLPPKPVSLQNPKPVSLHNPKPVDVRPLPPKPVSLQNPKPVSLHNPKPVDVRPLPPKPVPLQNPKPVHVSFPMLRYRAFTRYFPVENTIYFQEKKLRTYKFCIPLAEIPVGDFELFSMFKLEGATRAYINFENSKGALKLTPDKRGFVKATLYARNKEESHWSKSQLRYKRIYGTITTDGEINFGAVAFIAHGFERNMAYSSSMCPSMSGSSSSSPDKFDDSLPYFNWFAATIIPVVVFLSLTAFGVCLSLCCAKKRCKRRKAMLEKKLAEENEQEQSVQNQQQFVPLQPVYVYAPQPGQHQQFQPQMQPFVQQQFQQQPQQQFQQQPMFYAPYPAQQQQQPQQQFQQPQQPFANYYPQMPPNNIQMNQNY